MPPRLSGLRFDKVAVRVIDRLKAALRAEVPAGMIVVVTVTAPIRLASKTTDSIEERARALLLRGSAARDWSGTIQGNRVRIRLMKDRSRRVPRVIGFVHNPDVPPRILFDLAQESMHGPR